MLAVLAVPYATPRLRALRVVPRAVGHDAGTDDDASRLAARLRPRPPPGEQALPASENTRHRQQRAPDRVARRRLPDIDPDVRPHARARCRSRTRAGTRSTRSSRASRAPTARRPAPSRASCTTATRPSRATTSRARCAAGCRRASATRGTASSSSPTRGSGTSTTTSSTPRAASGRRAASRAPSRPTACTASAASPSRATAAGSPGSARRPRGDYGRKVSRFDVYYLEQPGGGDVELAVRGRPHRALLDTRRREGLARPLGARRPTARPSSPCARWAAARCASSAWRSSATSPGVVYDALGSHAAMAVYWQRQDRRALEGPARAARPGARRLPVRHQRERPVEARPRRVRARARGPRRRAPRGRAGRVRARRRAARSRRGQGRQARRPSPSSSISSRSSGASRSRTARPSGTRSTAMGGEGSMARWVKAQAAARRRRPHPPDAARRGGPRRHAERRPRRRLRRATTLDDHVPRPSGSGERPRALTAAHGRGTGIACPRSAGRSSAESPRSARHSS